MSQNGVLGIDSQTLVQAWQNTLPTFLDGSNQCSIQADAKYPDALLIHIENAGRSHYSLDFRCHYVDEREVHVDFLDVEKDHVSTDEQTEAVQQLAGDYVRNIHECAQQLKGLTNR